MPKFTIINIANKMPAWVVEASHDYLKRINNNTYSCNIIELKQNTLSNKSVLENLEIEAKKILNLIKKTHFVIVLDEKGKNLSSLQFAKKLDDIFLEYSEIIFIIGSAHGLANEIKSRANLILQLSSLTYPHTLARVVIIEQIYRAITILDNHPYHKE
mgnify:CR=1 FL=1